MGLKIQRVTQTKYKLLFASLAIMAIAVQPLYGFVASQVANAEPGPDNLVEFSATSVCLKGKVAINVTGESKVKNQASATYETTVGSKKLTGNWTKVKGESTVHGTLKSSEATAEKGEVKFDVPVVRNGVVVSHYEYTAGYNAIDCKPVFNSTSPSKDGITVYQSPKRFTISADVSTSGEDNPIKTVKWVLSGTSDLYGKVSRKSDRTNPKFLQKTDGTWSADYETVNIPTGVYKLVFTAIDKANNETQKEFNNLTIKVDRKAPNAKVEPSSTKSVDGINYASDRNKVQITGIAEDESNINQHWFEIKAPSESGKNNTYYAKDFSGTSKSTSFYLRDVVPTDSKNRAKNGTYVIRYVATDEFDNRSDCFRQPLCQEGKTTTYTLVIDNDLPDVSASMSNQDITLGDSNPTVTIQATDAGSDIDSSTVMYKVFKKGGDESKDVVIGWTSGLDESGNSYTGTVNVNKLSPGEYTLRARANDNASNKTSGADVDFKIKEATPQPGDGEVENDKEQTCQNPNGCEKEKPRPLTPEEEREGVPTVSDPTLNRTQSVNSIFNRNFALNLDANDDTATDQNEPQTDTLGDSTANAANGEDVKGAADEKAQSGLAWYWWALIVAAVAAIWWWIAAARKRNQDA